MKSTWTLNNLNPHFSTFKCDWSISVFVQLFVKTVILELCIWIFRSRWKHYKSSSNRQHWNVNWLHRNQHQYQRPQHHYIIIKLVHFGRTNSISNHYRLVHRLMGKSHDFLLFFSFDLYYFIANIIRMKKCELLTCVPRASS